MKHPPNPPPTFRLFLQAWNRWVGKTRSKTVLVAMLSLNGMSRLRVGGQFLPTFVPRTGPLGTRFSARNSQNFFIRARTSAARSRTPFRGLRRPKLPRNSGRGGMS